LIRTTSLLQTVYRASSVAYYRSGFSPIGSRSNGGRFNRPGISAIYVAAETQTAISEYRRSDPPRPLVLVAADVVATNLIDLTGDLSSWDADWQAWDTDWEVARDLRLAGDSTADSPSWRCGDAAIARNYSGILFPSRQNSGGKNLVLFPDHATTGSFSLKPIDPLGEILAAFPPV
jgi:RES domain-containing protein